MIGKGDCSLKTHIISGLNGGLTSKANVLPLNIVHKAHGSPQTCNKLPAAKTLTSSLDFTKI